MPSPAARARRASPVSLRPVRSELHHHPLVRTNGVRVGGDFREPRVSHEIQVGPFVTGQREIEGLAGGRHQLHQRQIGAPAQRLQVRDFE